MHPNIVNVYDVGEDNGVYYIVMELVDGITLKKYIEKKARLSVREALSIAFNGSMGIEAAHNNHIIHSGYQAAEHHYFQGRQGKGDGFWHCKSGDKQHDHLKRHGFCALHFSGAGKRWIQRRKE